MSILPRLLVFLIPQLPRVGLAVLLGLATAASNMGLLATAAYLVSAAALKPLLVALSVPIYLVRLCGIARGFARYGERLTAHAVTFGILAHLRTWFYARLEPLAPARLMRYRSGDLLARIVEDVDELENVYLRILAPLTVAVLVSVLTAGLLALFSRLLAVAALAFLLAAGAGVPLVVAALARGWGRRQLVLQARLHVAMVDGVQGVQDLLAFGRAADHLRTIASLDRELGRVQRRLALLGGMQTGLTELAMYGAMGTLLVLAIPLVNRGQIGGVYLALLALVVLTSFEAVRPVGQALAFLGRSLAAGDRLFELVDAPPAVTDPRRPLPAPGHAALEFERVCFAYVPDERRVLDEVSFCLKPGSRVAMVGPSGSGKSTLVNLAVRFYDPDGGTIRLGGHTLRAYAQEDVRRAIGVVTQETHIFNDTLRANLVLARPEAGEDALRTALERAQLASFVDLLPRGLDSPVGEQGLALSGGERQRLAIARALLKDAPLLILDEPTANLDPATERRVLAAVHALMEGRTTLLISHRLIGMEAMDEILVLHEGRIVERGTHAALSGAGGLYRQMLDVQNGVLAQHERLPAISVVPSGEPS